MPSKAEEQLLERLKSRAEASAPQRQTLSYVSGIAKCYFEGVHYHGGSRDRAMFSGGTSQNQYRSNFDPDRGVLRVTENQVTHFVEQVYSSTHPSQFDVDLSPAAFLSNQDADLAAEVHATAIDAEVEEYGLVPRAQLVNFRRCVNGTHILGLAVENRTAFADGKRLPDRTLKFFDADSTNLILDPACQELDLHLHPYVIYHDVWTLAQIKSMYGVDLNPEDCATIEQLEPVKIDMNTMSEDRLYSRYARFSKSKGARVYQIHERDESGYFSTWQIVIETARGEPRMRWVNESDPESPFGGCGLPFVLLHAHMRPDSIWSWGDVAQVMDEQKKLNLAATMYWRIVLRHAGSQWLVDRRAFGAQSTSEELRRKFTNQPYGVIDYSGSDRGRNFAAPQLIAHPPPPAHLAEEFARLREQIRAKSSRAPGHEGIQLSHVPNSSFKEGLQAADQPLGVRVNRDLEAYQYIMGVMHGTTIKFAKAMNPSTLAMLRDSGFDAAEFITIREASHVRLPVTIKIRESSVRFRPLEEKRNDLQAAVAAQAISAEDYQDALVELDTPLTREAAQMHKEAIRAANLILTGKPWVPKRLGQWGRVFIKAFIRAGFDKRAKADPRIGQLLDQAVQLQQQVALQEAIASNPELAIKQQEAAVGGGNSGAQPNTQDESMPETVSISKLLAMAQGGPRGVPASAA